MFNVTMAFMPIFLVFILLIFFKVKASITMAAAYIASFFIGLFVWQISLKTLFASSIQGAIIASSILWILFGAIVFLNLLKDLKVKSRIKEEILSCSENKYVLLVLISFFFGSFIEGIAGFGTPAVICAPLLVTIGFTPFSAVVLSLIANTVPVLFGAIGTPVLIGLENGIGHIVNPEFIEGTYLTASKIDFLTASLMPTFLVLIYAKFFSKAKKIKDGFKYIPFTLFSGMFFAIISFATAFLTGPQLPTVIAGLSGLFVALYIAKNKLMFLPKEEIRHIKESPLQMLKTLSPYLFVVLILLVSTLIPEVKTFLSSKAIKFNNILGTEISTSLSLLTLPGTALLLASFLTLIVFRKPIKFLKKPILESFKTLEKMAFVLIITIAFVRIFINSGINSAGLSSMSWEVANFLTNFLKGIYPLVSPLIGAFGSFLSGSATFSNMMFSTLQYDTALQIGVNPQNVVAGQMLGANYGNMVSISNIIAVSAVLGLENQEGKVLKFVIIPLLLITTTIGIIVYLLG